MPEAITSGWQGAYICIRCATQTEPQWRIRRPSQRQTGKPGDPRASPLAKPDYSVAQPDVVLRASFEESSELNEEDRHGVLGAFMYTPPTSKANEDQERPGLSRIEFLGSLKPSSPTRRELIALQLQLQALEDDTMDSSPQYGGGNKGTPSPMFDGTGVRNSVATAEIYFDSIHATAMLLSTFSITSIAATIAKLKRVKFDGDLDTMAEQLTDILANEESVPSAKAKEIFLSRLIYELAPRAFKTDLKTWAQVREYLRRELKSEHELGLAWYENISESNRRWAERSCGSCGLSKEAIVAGWLP
ncbi:hypothetical protein Efla_002436 [Eimeria flavescens]